MSKKEKRGPKVQSPEPHEDAPAATMEQTTGAIKTPEAIPANIMGLARLVKAKWGVPIWLTAHAAYTGSKFGKNPDGAHNWCGVVSKGTEPKTETGRAWYGSPLAALDFFGSLCKGLDFSDKAGCIKALKTRCPEIDSISHNTYKEV